MNKKADIKPRDWVIAGGMFILIIFTGVWAISTAFVDEPGLIDSDKFEAFNSTFNKFDTYNEKISDLESGVKEIAASEGGGIAFLNNLINQGWNTLRLLFDTFNFLDDALDGLATVWGIPTFIPKLLIGIVTTIFIFSILAVIFNRDV